MMVRSKNSTHIALMLSLQELAKLNAVAAERGLPRNRLLRDLIASLPEPKEKK